MKSNYSLFLFRNDLRLIDHPGLFEFVKNAGANKNVIFAFSFSDELGRFDFKWNVPKFRRMSANRIQFLIESLEDLSKKLPLHILENDVKLKQFCEAQHVDEIHVTEEVGSEEKHRLTNLKKNLPHVKFFVSKWTNTLYDARDFKFDVTKASISSFSKLRKMIENEKTKIRDESTVSR